MNDEAIIALVEQCPHLYNRSLREYKDDQKKQNSWASIADHLNVEVATVTKRWENLRDRFVRAQREFTIKLPSGSAGGCRNYPKFIYYKQMQWLAPFIRKRKLTSSFKSDLAEYSMEASTSKRFTEDDISLQEFTELEFEVEVLGIDEEKDDETNQGTFEMGTDRVISPAPSFGNPGSSQIFNTKVQDSEEISSPNPSLENPGSSRLWTPRQKEKQKMQDTMAKAITNFTKVLEERRTSSSYPSDMNFMKSVVEDMQVLPIAKRIRFKKDILDLLVQYVEEP